MSFITNIVTAYADWAWGVPMLVVLVGGGILLTIAIRGLQFGKLGYVLKNTIGKNMGAKGEGSKISGYQAVISAMAATLGTGNIVGVGAAIALGGPGAIFWMWVVGLVSMGIKYCEALVSVKFREPNPEFGGYKAGPSMYLRKGIDNKVIAKVLAVAYAIFSTWALLMSGPEHTAAIVDVVNSAFNVPRLVITLVCVAIVGAIMLGGIKSFVSVSEKIVPFMAILYCATGLVIIVMNITTLPGVFVAICKDAFTGTAAVGGFTGAGMAQAIRWGTARGVYSSDAGNGLQSIMHGQAECDHPVQQAMWGVFEVFIDTIVVCSFTAFTILCTGVWETGADGSTLALSAFTQSCGTVGMIVASVSLALFAITSAIGMASFMERQSVMLFGRWPTRLLQVLFLVMMVIGGNAGFSATLPYTDMSTATIIFVNVAGLLIMSKKIRETTDDYFNNFIKQDRKKN